MTLQSRNRYIEAATIFASNPINSARFLFDYIFRKRGTSYILSFRGIEIRVRPNSSDLRVVRTCLLGEFDEVFPRIGSKHQFIVDAGGYIGLVSILMAIRFPNSHIVCLEPSSENFKLAQENCAPYRNIEVWNCALAPETGELVLSDRSTGPWGYTVVSESADCEQTVIETVQAHSIEDILDHFGKTGIDFLKLDIEGGEKAVLEGAPNWLNLTEIMVVELHDRIAPGATQAYEEATVNRIDVPMIGEKLMSVTPNLDA